MIGEEEKRERVILTSGVRLLVGEEDNGMRHLRDRAEELTAGPKRSGGTRDWLEPGCADRWAAAVGWRRGSRSCWCCAEADGGPGLLAEEGKGAGPVWERLVCGVPVSGKGVPRVRPCWGAAGALAGPRFLGLGHGAYLG